MLSGGTKTSDTSIASDIAENQNRLRTLRDELLSTLSGKISGRIEKGEVVSMPRVRKPLSIADGWTQRHLYSTPGFDIWYKEGQPGASIAPHHHPNHTILFFVLVGELEIAYGGAAGPVSFEPEKKTTLESQNSLLIPAGTSHYYRAVEGVQMITIYQPPIGRFVSQLQHLDDQIYNINVDKSSNSTSRAAKTPQKSQGNVFDENDTSRAEEAFKTCEGSSFSSEDPSQQNQMRD